MCNVSPHCRKRGFKVANSLAKLFQGALLALCIATVSPTHAALSTADIETQNFERAVADDPRAALNQSKIWLQEAVKRGDTALQLRGQRQLVMAISALEESTQLAQSAEEGLSLARKLADPQAICEFLSAKATAMASAGKHAEALPLLDEAAAVALNANLKRAQIGVVVTRAYTLSLIGKDTDALELLSSAHQSYVDLDDVESARSTLSTIGNSYRREGANRADLLRALGYMQQAIFPNAERSRRHSLATDYYNMALIYDQLKDFDNAKLFLEKSIALSKALNDPIGIAFSNTRLGNLAAENGAWEVALSYADAALPELKRAGDSTMVFSVQRQRAKALANLGRRKESLDALREAEKLREGVPWKNAVYLRTSADVYSKLGDFEKAYNFQVEFQKADATSQLQAREKDALNAQVKFELKQKEAENALLRARGKESDAKRWVLALAVGLLLLTLSGLGYFLYRQSQENRRYATLALRDDLTALPNRRSILQFAHAQLKLGHENQQTFCLALIDIDHFKSINDNYGHAIGDAVLTAFAITCKQTLRTDDRIGRYGGEEFLLILPNFFLPDIPAFFEQLRIAVQQIRVLGLPATYVLAFSMGVVETDSKTSVDGLIKRADDALYKAKNGGRDRFKIG